MRQIWTNSFHSINFSFAWFSRGGGNAPKVGCVGVWVCTLKSDHLRPRHKEQFENSLGYLVRKCLKKQEQSPVGLLSGDPDLPFPETAFVASLPSAGATPHDSSQSSFPVPVVCRPSKWTLLVICCWNAPFHFPSYVVIPGSDTQGFRASGLPLSQLARLSQLSDLTAQSLNPSLVSLQ